ncbi:PAS domain S-box protein [Halovenus halobia]|uniref:PAS domain S-box protein n=1 Tax=Halovenus halobia TaxID=3396622 RepID=UPI003F54C6E8
MGNGADSDFVESLLPGLAALDEPIFLFDADCQLRTYNDAAHEFTGLSGSPPAEITLTDLFDEADSRTLHGAIEEALANDSATARVTLTGEHTQRHVVCSLSSLSVHGEQLVVCLCQEVDQQRDQIQTEQHQRYESLVQQSNDGIAIVQDQQIVFANETLAATTGYDLDALRGKPFYELCTPEYQQLVRERHQRRLDGETPPEQYKLEIETQAGNIRVVDLSVSRTTHEGRPATLVTVRDRTDRQRRQWAIETLQDATRRIQQAETTDDVARVAVEAATDVFGLPYAVCWLHDEETDRLDPAYATTAARNEGFVGSFSPDSYEHEVFRAGELTKYTPEAVSADNSLTNAILLPLGEHGLIGVGGTEHIEFDETIIDVTRSLADHTTTALKRVEQTRELREERALTESIFAALPDVFYAFDEQGNFFRWNDQFAAVTGYSDADIESMHPAEFFVPDERETIYNAIAEVFEHDTTVTVEARFLTSDGERIPYEFTGAKLTDATGEVLGLVGIGRDISDRKQRQRRFEAVFNNTYQFTGLMEPDGTLLEANDAALEFGGLEADDVIGVNVWEASWFQHSPAVRDEVKDAVERAADGEFVRKELPISGADREAFIDFSVRPVTNENGEITLLIPEGRDITELKERERELRRERDHIRRTEAQAAVGGWELDLSTETVYWTDGLRDLYDVSSSFEPSYDESLSWFHPENRETVRDAIDACRTNGTPFDLETRVVTAAGRTRWIRMEGERVDEQDTKKLRGAVRDITERKEREQRLMVFNRVLRHNLRNKLTVVGGYADHLESQLETLAHADDDTAFDEFAVEEALRSVREIRAGSDDLSSISRKVRQFGAITQEVDVTDTVAVRTILTGLGEEYSADYPNATIDLTVEDVHIKGNAEFLKLVVGELVENAIEHNDTGTPRVELTVTADGDDRVQICVADDGPGIPDMEREVLREGQEGSLLHGSGIGLWTIHWLVTRVGGNVSIADNDPQGTVVTLSIPRADA